jgi:hypothetical protein
MSFATVRNMAAFFVECLLVQPPSRSTVPFRLSMTVATVQAQVGKIRQLLHALAVVVSAGTSGQLHQATGADRGRNTPCGHRATSWRHIAYPAFGLKGIASESQS